AAFGVENWDEERFRETLAANLRDGRFRLVIAVDEITDEIKRIVLFLNEHTSTDLQVQALELGFIADEGVEILVPAVYGTENRKPATTASSSMRKWTEDTVF